MLLVYLTSFRLNYIVKLACTPGAIFCPLQANIPGISCCPCHNFTNLPANSCTAGKLYMEPKYTPTSSKFDCFFMNVYRRPFYSAADGLRVQWWVGQRLLFCHAFKILDMINSCWFSLLVKIQKQCFKGDRSSIQVLCFWNCHILYLVCISHKWNLQTNNSETFLKWKIVLR